MRVLRALYAELVYGGHLLAAGTSSIAATAALAIGRVPTWDLLLMAYLFTFGAYSLNRASDFDQDVVSHPARTAHLKGRRPFLPWIAALCFAAGYILAFRVNWYFFGALLVPPTLALLYSVGSGSLKRIVGISRLKEGFFVKNLAISFGWSLIPLLVGLYYLDVPLSAVALAPFIFLRLMVNTIFFDARDVEADMKFGVRTLPSRLGTRMSGLVMDALDVSSALLMVSFVLLGFLPFSLVWLSLFTVYSFTYRRLSTRLPGRQDALRDLAADGEYVFWGLVTSIGQA